MSAYVQGLIVEEEILELQHPGNNLSVYCVIFRTTKHSLKNLVDKWRGEPEAMERCTAAKALYLTVQMLDCL